MWSAEVCTAWTGDGVTEETCNRALLVDEYALRYFQDVTGQEDMHARVRPDPNLYIVRVECEADVLDAIEADSRFYVLWSEEIVEEVL